MRIKVNPLENEFSIIVSLVSFIHYFGKMVSFHILFTAVKNG
jgi:hypothetical protein